MPEASVMARNIRNSAVEVVEVRDALEDAGVQLAERLGNAHEFGFVGTSIDGVSTPADVLVLLGA